VAIPFATKKIANISFQLRYSYYSYRKYSAQSRFATIVIFNHSFQLRYSYYFHPNCIAQSRFATKQIGNNQIFLGYSYYFHRKYRKLFPTFTVAIIPYEKLTWHGRIVCYDSIVEYARIAYYRLRKDLINSADWHGICWQFWLKIGKLTSAGKWSRKGKTKIQFDNGRFAS